jgi:hypothetical protein
MKAKKKPLTEQTISEVMREMGRRGGKARVPKGISSLSKRKRSVLAKKAASARWEKYRQDALKAESGD